MIMVMHGVVQMACVKHKLSSEMIMKLFFILITAFCIGNTALADSLKEIEYDEKTVLSTAKDFIVGNVIDVVEIKNINNNCFNGMVKISVESSLSKKHKKGDVVQFGITKNSPLPTVNDSYAWVVYEKPKNFYSRCKKPKRLRHYDLNNVYLIHGARYARIFYVNDVKKFEYNTCNSKIILLYEDRFLEKEITHLKNKKNICRRLVGNYEEFEKYILSDLSEI